MTSKSLRYLVSIHDVMPDTLEAVEGIFNRLQSAGLKPITLLVVPGKDWSPEQIERVRDMVEAGAELAGHGWSHHVPTIRGFKHRLHSALISRDVAEHLALSADEAVHLMQRCHDWFVQQQLPSPALYVPPAWAMGSVSRCLLDTLPFSRFETFAGVYVSSQSRFIRLPMMGFEADTTFRALTVSGWNRLNASLSRLTNRPVRFGIHPKDYSLKLAPSIDRWQARCSATLSYTQLG